MDASNNGTNVGIWKLVGSEGWRDDQATCDPICRQTCSENTEKLNMSNVYLHSTGTTQCIQELLI